MLKIVKMEVGSTCTVEKLKDFDFSGWSKRLRNNVVEFSQPKFENSTYFPSNGTIVSDNTTIKIGENSILTANFHHRDTIVDWIEQLGPVIGTISLAAVIVIASISQYLFGHRRKGELKSDPKDWIMDRINLITIDASVVVGVLVFLSLEGFSRSQQTQVTLVTANIVFPFAISAIFSVVNRVAFGTRLMVAGFVNLMMSIVIIAVIKLNS